MATGNMDDFITWIVLMCGFIGFLLGMGKVVDANLQSLDSTTPIRSYMGMIMVVLGLLTMTKGLFMYLEVL